MAKASPTLREMSESRVEGALLPKGRNLAGSERVVFRALEEYFGPGSLSECASPLRCGRSAAAATLKLGG